MSRGRQAQVVKLSKKECKALEVWCAASTAPQRRRCASEDCTDGPCGRDEDGDRASLGMSVPSVSKWRGRVAVKVFRACEKWQRSGRPRRIGDAQRLELLSLACEPAEEQGRATPTLDELCERAVERGVV